MGSKRPAKLKYLRRVNGTSHKDRVSNTEIRRRISTKLLSELLKECELRCLGYINRMNDMRPTKLAENVNA